MKCFEFLGVLESRVLIVKGSDWQVLRVSMGSSVLISNASSVEGFKNVP